jgi:hypothetical protein
MPALQARIFGENTLGLGRSQIPLAAPAAGRYNPRRITRNSSRRIHLFGCRSGSGRGPVLSIQERGKHMGKRLWYGVAGAALVAGGAFWAADYGRRNPDSAVGRSVCAVCGPGARPVALPGQADPGEEAESLIPADPTPAVEDPVPAFGAAPATADVPGPVATGPAAIAIPDEEPSQPATVAALPQEAPAGAAEECCEHGCSSEGARKTLVMPYCPAEDAPAMPYAIDDWPQTLPAKGPAGETPAAGFSGVAERLREFLTGPFGRGAWAPAGCPGCPDGGPCPACSDPAAGHGLPLKQTPVLPAFPAAGGGQGEVLKACPKCDGKKGSCPEEGKPEARLESKKLPTYFPALKPYLPRKGLDGMEECEAPAEAGPKATPAAGRPVVDTMEFRPSDGRFDDARRGPW